MVYWSSVCFGELEFGAICYIVVWYNLLFYSLVQFGGNGCWEEERCRWERGDRTTTSISNACNAALLYVRSSCNSRTCAAHKYVPTFTHAGQFSAVCSEEVHSLLCTDCGTVCTPVWEQRQIVYAELIFNKRRRLVKPSQM